MLLHKNKKNQNAKGNKLLISIAVLGSAGLIRFVVNEKELVAMVMDTALKSYAREGRLPVLGSDLNDFMLYCPYVGTDGYDQTRKPISILIYLRFARSSQFYVVKRQPEKLVDNGGPTTPATTITRKGSGSWKAWINKSLNLKISSH
ncbi:hypothetical protein FNV43_RR05804 [Rhamnella rubrinervis]|uniref:DUF7054 domain-containing protein n=1 Tax=Rhamnella rubrinervis TaxID=2594499 RepID=A0A8K0HPR0_9ROSA|nr:hypothetical protein FNV43_RR05804 [Rhamnella rubrinervis]